MTTILNLQKRKKEIDEKIPPGTLVRINFKGPGSYWNLHGFPTDKKVGIGLVLGTCLLDNVPLTFSKTEINKHIEFERRIYYTYPGEIMVIMFFWRQEDINICL